jgi:outer membrane protein OmpA-like peptidoglycan-associated protein
MQRVWSAEVDVMKICKASIRTVLATGILALPVAHAAGLSEEHIGSASVSKDEFINRLAPEEPQFRTRGIRLSTPSAGSGGSTASATPPASPRAVSMEIQFEFGSADLTQGSRQQLAPLGEALNSPELASLSFVLEGHTDAVGESEYNLALSQRRAESVKYYLVDNYGVRPDRLTTVGRGESALLDPHDPSSGVNRRVRIVTQQLPKQGSR